MLFVIGFLEAFIVLAANLKSSPISGIPLLNKYWVSIVSMVFLDTWNIAVNQRNLDFTIKSLQSKILGHTNLLNCEIYYERIILY